VSGARRFIANLRSLVFAAIIGALCGCASAIFLVGLDRITAERLRTPYLLYLLPLAGLVIGAIYEKLGESIRGGNDLVIDTIHDDGPEIPLRMAPLVLVGTWLTHLFGGSAGREGTAVQMGASLADFVANRLRRFGASRTALVAAGVAGGFGSVFGTPIAGTIFGLEFVVRGRIEVRAFAPALTAAVAGDMVTLALGVRHTRYPNVGSLALSPVVVAKWIVFGVVVALVSTAFVELTHALKDYGKRRVPSLPLRMFFGGLAVVGLTYVVGTRDYLGLGVPTILRAFDDAALPVDAFAWKLVFTAITVGAGFLGGEVTPLFFVGATLGNLLGRILGLPLDLAAAVGLATMFGCASHTPLALSIMAVELFGAHALPHVMIVSAVAFLCAGHRGIYRAQRVPAEPSLAAPSHDVQEGHDTPR